jgi:hypothetical protein
METSARSARLGRHLASQDGRSRTIQICLSPPDNQRTCQYEFERRKYAQDLIAFDKTFSALFSEKFRVDNEGHNPTHEEFMG